MQTDPLWYKDAIFYELSVRTFYDSDGDGIGDFIGAAQKLPYLQDLGVTCVCLLPFFASPLKDDGYDITDFYQVQPEYGTLDDCRAFIDAAHALGLRVITDLVINHTSDQHPWFTEARFSRTSAYRNWYVWSDTPDPYPDARVRFTDFEYWNWTWDPPTRAYYWHRFFAHQPDLNFANPDVRAEMLNIARFWLDVGFDGLRYSGVDYLYEQNGNRCEGVPETHAYCQYLRQELARTHPGTILLGDTAQWPKEAAQFFANENEFQVATNAALIPRLFLGLARADRRPITDIFVRTPPIPASCQWTTFLRNHDELTLTGLTEDECEELYAHYGYARHMRLHGGIRRRLAPLVRHDLRQLELLYRVLLSLPGSPMLYYGDDIGMEGKVYLYDRQGLRTPMQWTADRNAGFSTADSDALTAPVSTDPFSTYIVMNVEEQQRLSYSLVRLLQRLIVTRQRYTVFGRGSLEVLQPTNTHVLAYTREYGTDVALVVNNLSDRMQPVQLDLARFRGMQPIEMCGGAAFPIIGPQPYFLCVGPYHSMWLHLTHGRQP